MDATTPSAVSAMVELDAHEFGAHVRSGGWRLGLLVARNVEPGEGEGTNRSVRSGSGKVSATWFAERSGTFHSRVMRYFRAWERAAEKGYVPAPDDLHPGEEPDLDWDRLPRWKSFFNPVALDTGGATGPLNLTIKLGQYGERLLRTHKRLVYFVERELPEQKPGKDVRALAGRYAAGLEAQARVLRQVEAGERVDIDQAKHTLDPTHFFKTA